MLFNYRFHGASGIENSANATRMTLSPDVSRLPTFFRGQLAKKVSFREAISALHYVVVSDLRFKPKDKTAYLEWLATQEPALLVQASAHQPELLRKIETLNKELSQVRSEKSKVMTPFYNARASYFKYLYEKERDKWFVLDPVITVHPDEVFFECFSQDESTYGRLGCSYEVFKNISEFSCGTTNIDYSAGLYNEFQKVRDYKEMDFTIDPGGFEVKVTKEDSFTERKIDLPDSWVRGFLQVSSAMTLPLRRIDLHPMDVHNICFMLRRHKEQNSPRSLRFILRPGEPITLRFEPWNIELKCPRSIYHGTEADEIRLWGRRRLLILERLIPVAKGFTAYLMGSGMPSFFLADLGNMSFTLGLSGWTANDWSKSGSFDLMAARTETDPVTRDRVFNALKENWCETPASLAKRLNLNQKMVEGALTAWTQAGRVMYDLNKQVYRVRELSAEPLPMDKLRFSDPREQQATTLADAKAVEVLEATTTDGALYLKGTVTPGKSPLHVQLWIDRDERISNGICGCAHYFKNKMHKGPCEHMIALRIAHSRKTWWSKWLMN